VFVVLVRAVEYDDREVSTMAATIDIEFEAGVYAAPTRRHRGYWAGDFSRSADADASS
jgi:hypothetical protein